MIEQKDCAHTPESEINPHTIAVTTSTFYREWYEGERRSLSDIDKIRGDLVLQTLEKMAHAGFQLIVIDGGSSEIFIHKAENYGITVHPQTHSGLSGSRQQSFSLVKQLDDIQVICTMETEKISFVDSLKKAALPILENTADIVIPKRDEQAFATYPNVQAYYEQRGNRLVNNILKGHGLLAKKASDLDLFFGVRIFRNEQRILQLFEQKYAFHKSSRPVDQLVMPERWSNALFLPIIGALHKRLHVESFPIKYRHPEEQTASEIGNPAMDRKREIQFKDNIVNAIEFIRNLEANPDKPSRLLSI